MVASVTAAPPRRVVLLDGGMGQELVARSRHPVHPLWSAMVMLQEPEIVREVHLDYIEAGARVITLNAYSVTAQRLARDGIAEKFGPLQAAACRAAREARAEAGVPGVRIAGCLPPLVASYRPELTPPDAEAAAEYARIAEAQAGEVDLFLCETMASAREGRLAAAAAAATGRPVWVAFTLADDAPGIAPRLRSGETVAEAVAALEGLGVEAILANCSRPEAIDAACADFAATGRPWGGYANGFTGIAALAPGTTVEVLETRRDLGPEAYAGHALRWLAEGATILGGCCEVGPAHIAEIARRLREGGHEIAGALA